MLVQALAQRGPGRQVVVGLLVGIDRTAFDVAHRLVEHRGIAGCVAIVAGNKRQPQEVVGTARAHAAVHRRMPPVQHVALRELMRGAQQQVGAHPRRLGVHHRHRVLQLVAESECAAGLVIATAREEAAADRLVQQPAVREHIDARLRGFHLDRAERTQPVDAHRVQRIVRGIAAARALGQRDRLAPVATQPQPEYGLAGLPGVQRDRHLDCGARVQACAELSRQAFAQQRRGALQVAVAAEEFGAVAGDAAGAGASAAVIGIEEGDAALEFGVVAVARGQHAAVAVDFGDHVHLRPRMQVAEDPFDIAGGAQPARAPGPVVQLEHAVFHRVLQADVHPQFAGDAVLDMLVHAVAETVARAIRPGSAARQWHRRPHASGLFVAQVEGLARGIADRIVVPWGQAELVRVLAPGIAGRALAHHAAELRVGEHVRPGCGRGLPVLEVDDVFASIGREATDAIAEETFFRNFLERPRIVWPVRVVVSCRGRCVVSRQQFVLDRRRHQHRHDRCDRRTPADLFGQGAARIAEDHPRHRLQQHPVFLRDLLRRAHEDATGPVDHVRFDARGDQAHDLVLQLLPVTGLVLVPDHQVDRQPLQPPVGVRLHQLPHQFDVGRIADLQQHHRVVAGDRLAPQPRLAATVLQQHGLLGAQCGAGVQHEAGEALVQLRIGL